MRRIGLLWIGLLWIDMACACGKVSNNTPVDADLIDADLTGMLSVTTQTRYFVAGGAPVGAAQATVDVVSMRPNDTVADMVQTDTTGHADLKIYPGGSITAIYKHPADMGADLVTYFGAKPNDALTFGQRFSPDTFTTVGAMTFTYPALAGATSYDVFGPCGGNGVTAPTLSITLTESTNCHRTPMDVVYVAFNTNNQVIGYNYVNLPFASGGSRAIGGWVPANTAMVNVTGLPPEVQNVFAQFTNIGNLGSTNEQMFSRSVNGQSTGGAYTDTFPWDATDVLTEAHLFLSRAGTYQAIQIVDALQPSTTSWTVASAALPPWLQTFTLSLADQMAIMYLVGEGSYDAAVFQVRWVHVVGTTQTVSSWTFILPPKMTTFTFPKLPAQFAAQLPQPEDFVQFPIMAGIIEIPSVPDYDALRAIPEKSLICPGSLVPDCALHNGEFPRLIYELGSNFF